jgi:hypothetical protein
MEIGRPISTPLKLGSKLTGNQFLIQMNKGESLLKFPINK